MAEHDDGTAASRLKPRFKLFQPTTMAVGRDMCRVHLLDLSITGALVHCAAPPEQGAVVRLECAGRMRMARIAWVKGTRLGLSFVTPLTEDQVAGTLAEQCALAAAQAVRPGSVA